MDKSLVLADRLKKLKDQVDSLATKQTEIQTIKGDQGPKGEQGDRGFDGAPGLDGRDGKDGKDGAEGKDGVSVVKAEIAFDGSLVLYLSNGDQIDCGEVTPEKGKEVFQTIKNSGGSSPIDIFTSVLPGLVPASGGGTSNFLRADGTFAAPPTGSPASPTTSVQFNNAGAFGGSANFTYTSGTDTLSVGKLVSANFTSAAQGLVPASGGGTANFLRADGTFAAPPATAPAGANTQIQFNNAGAFGATAGFSYDTSSSIYTFNIAPANITQVSLEPVAPTGSQTSTNIRLRTRDASATNAASGGISVFTGRGNGTGGSGSVTFTTGVSPSGTAGQIRFISGNGAVYGGNMLFDAGSGTSNGTGGTIQMSAGRAAGTGSGGGFELQGGNAPGTGFGGGFYMASGGATSGVSGDFQLLVGGGGASSGSIYMGTDSNSACLTITEDGSAASQMGFFNAAPVTQPTTATGSATFVVNSGGSIHPTSTFDGYTLAQVVRALRDLGILA